MYNYFNEKQKRNKWRVLSKNGSFHLTQVKNRTHSYIIAEIIIMTMLA